MRDIVKKADWAVELTESSTIYLDSTDICIENEHTLFI